MNTNIRKIAITALKNQISLNLDRYESAEINVTELIRLNNRAFKWYHEEILLAVIEDTKNLSEPN